MCLINAWGRIMPVFIPKAMRCGPRAQTKNTAPIAVHRRTTGFCHCHRSVHAARIIGTSPSHPDTSTPSRRIAS